MNDDIFDILIYKNSKPLFYRFYLYLHSENRPGQLVRYSVISDDKYALDKAKNKKKKNWSYFIDRIVQFYQRCLDLNSYSISDREEADIILNTKENFNILKNIYQNFYTSLGLYLHNYLYNLPLP